MAERSVHGGTNVSHHPKSTVDSSVRGVFCTHVVRRVEDNYPDRRAWKFTGDAYPMRSLSGTFHEMEQSDFFHTVLTHVGSRFVLSMQTDKPSRRHDRLASSTLRRFPSSSWLHLRICGACCWRASANVDCRVQSLFHEPECSSATTCEKERRNGCRTAIAQKTRTIGKVADTPCLKQ